MKIRISDKHTIEYNNGYYMTYQNAIRSPESKEAGEEYTCLPQTFALLSGAVTVLKLEGYDKQVITEAFEKSYKHYQQKESQSWLKVKANKKGK